MDYYEVYPVFDNDSAVFSLFDKVLVVPLLDNKLQNVNPASSILTKTLLVLLMLDGYNVIPMLDNVTLCFAHDNDSCLYVIMTNCILCLTIAILVLEYIA